MRITEAKTSDDEVNKLPILLGANIVLSNKLLKLKFGSKMHDSLQDIAIFHLGIWVDACKHECTGFRPATSGSVACIWCLHKKVSVRRVGQYR